MSDNLRLNRRLSRSRHILCIAAALTPFTAFVLYQLLVSGELYLLRKSLLSSFGCFGPSVYQSIRLLAHDSQNNITLCIALVKIIRYLKLVDDAQLCKYHFDNFNSALL